MVLHGVQFKETCDTDGRTARQAGENGRCRDMMGALGALRGVCFANLGPQRLLKGRWNRSRHLG